MITLEWNTGDDTPTTVTTTELTGSIAFQIEQWYEISSQNEVPRYRTESTFTVSDAVIKIPDEIFVTLILTAQGTGVTTSREFAYSVLKQLSDNGTVIKLDASEQGTRTSYDRVVIKRMSNIVRVNEEYFCKLVFSEIRTAELAIVEETEVSGESYEITVENLGPVDSVRTYFMGQNYITEKTDVVVTALEEAERKTEEFDNFSSDVDAFNGTEFAMTDFMSGLNAHISVIASGEATYKVV